MSDQKIKIVTLLSSLEKSGVTTVVYNICKYLDYSKFSMHIVTLFPESDHSDLELFQALPLQIHSLQFARNTPDFKIKEGLLNCCKSIHPHIVHTHTFRADMLAGKYLNHYTRAVTLHSILEHNNTNTHGFFLGKLMALIQLWYFRKATLRFAVSYSIQAHYAKFLSMSVIQNGADPEIFKPADEAHRGLLKNKLSIPSDKKIYITVGALSKRKDPITLIQAFLNSKHVTDSILYVLGTGPLQQSCEQLIGNHPAVVLVGHTNRPIDYYQVADVLISASHSEGLPNTLLEAGLCNVPCILSDIPQHREIFRNGPGVYSVAFFPVAQVQDLTQCINDFSPTANQLSFPLNARKMAETYGQHYLSIKQ